MMVMVRTDTPNARRGAKGISTFIVPTDSKGYKAAKPEDKMGLRASNTAGIALTDLRLPASHMLGDEGMGFVYAMEGLDNGRLGIGAQGVGIARKAIELSLKYCAERRQFGKAIEDFQAVQFKLADMATRTEAARALAHRAAARKMRARILRRTPAWRSCSRPKRRCGSRRRRFSSSGVWVHARFPRRETFPGCKGHRDL